MASGRSFLAEFQDKIAVTGHLRCQDINYWHLFDDSIACLHSNTNCLWFMDTIVRFADNQCHSTSLHRDPCPPLYFAPSLISTNCHPWRTSCEGTTPKFDFAYKFMGITLIVATMPWIGQSAISHLINDGSFNYVITGDTIKELIVWCGGKHNHQIRLPWRKKPANQEKEIYLHKHLLWFPKPDINIVIRHEKRLQS
jgi:hypothetical protein